MRIHHLNCGTILFPGARLVCHVLLIESPAGLILVDTGFGLADIAEPARRLGVVRRLIRPVLDPAETAIRQVERLGFAPADVRHIVLTHLDLDHIGGLADFPHASVHVSTAEAAVMRTPSRRERYRYRPVQWAHGPKLVEHSMDGEPWQGFATAREVITPGVLYLALPGHTRGHAAVAVDSGNGWLVHAGDAFYHHGTLDGSTVPRFLRINERLVAEAPKQVMANHERLAELYRQTGSGLTIFCAHDPAQYPNPRR